MIVDICQVYKLVYLCISRVVARCMCRPELWSMSIMTRNERTPTYNNGSFQLDANSTWAEYVHPNTTWADPSASESILIRTNPFRTRLMSTQNRFELSCNGSHVPNPHLSIRWLNLIRPKLLLPSPHVLDPS